MSIQIINKTNYTLQRAVPTPSDLSPLPPSSVRIRTTLISLTTNNHSYAQLGGLGLPGLAYWDVWPFPATLPEPYNDAETYCRISAWGFAKVIDSNIVELPVGQELYGYWPIADRSEVLELERGGEGQWLEVSEGRGRLNGIYNRYFEVNGDGEAEGEGGEEGKWWDALMKTLFETGYLMDKFAFAAGEGRNAIHPSGNPHLPWTPADATLTNAVVILIGASGKTALSLAYLLQHRPPPARPAGIIAVGSTRSQSFVEKTGFYDRFFSYEDASSSTLDIASELSTEGKKVVLVTFDTRTGSVEKWAAAVQGKCERLQIVIVGAPGDGAGGLHMGLIGRAQDPTSGVVISDAGGTRTEALAVLGEGKYFAGLDEAWERFKGDGALPGVRLVRQKGMESLVREWDALVRGEHGPETGLLFELS